MNEFSGVGVSDGFATGKAVFLKESKNSFTDTEINEKERFQKAVEEYIAETKTLFEKTKMSIGEDEAKILKGHISVATDEALLNKIYAEIEEGLTAEQATEKAVNSFSKIFEKSPNEIIRKRNTDLSDIKNGILSFLSNKSRELKEFEKGSVIVAKDIEPSLICRMNKENVAAVISENGGYTSHSAILLRAFKIPAVFKIDIEKIQEKENLFVNGCSGKVFTDFDEELILRKTKKKTPEKVKTSLRVLGNVCFANEVKTVIENGGDGVGLFRTEFLFMKNNSAPDEEAQFSEYVAAAKFANGKEVVIRTLDTGGDKVIPYLKTEKRGIRYSFENEAVFKTQVRAILRAAVFGNLKILLPFVTTAGDLKRAKKIIENCINELEKEKKLYRRVPVGVMIETPSAAVVSDLLSKNADFFSIGTNDLVPLTAAAERGKAADGEYFNVFQESVLRLIKLTIKNAKKNGVPVCVCGEAANDFRLIKKLAEWGADSVSVSYDNIPKIAF